MFLGKFSFCTAFQHKASTHCILPPQNGAYSPQYKCKTNHKLELWGNLNLGLPYPWDILAAILGEQPHFAPPLISDPRHSQTDPLSQNLSFIPSIFPTKSPIRSPQPAPIDCMYNLTKKQTTSCSASQ